MSAAVLARPLAHRCVWLYPRSPRRIGPACGDRTPSSESECAGHCSFGLFLIENGRNEVRRHGLEMGGVHRITGAALRKRPNGSRVTEQLSEGNLGMNNGKIAACLDIVDAATAASYIAADFSLHLI